MTINVITIKNNNDNVEHDNSIKDNVDRLDDQPFSNLARSHLPVSISLAVVSDSVSGCSPGVRAATGAPPFMPAPPMTSLPTSLRVVPKPTSRIHVDGGESTPPTDMATT